MFQPAVSRQPPESVRRAQLRECHGANREKSTIRCGLLINPDLVGHAILTRALAGGMQAPDLVTVARPSNHVEPSGPLQITRHYVRELIYGSNDGIITTFAVVAGVAGGSLAPAVVLICGVANLVADGLSMAVGNYLAIRAHESVLEAQGLPEEEAAPARHGIATFAAFVAAGVLPLIPYLIPGSAGDRFGWSIVVTLVGLFGVGALRALIAPVRWWAAGAEMSGLGGIVAFVAYGSGMLIAGLVGSGPSVG